MHNRIWTSGFPANLKTMPHRNYEVKHGVNLVIPARRELYFVLQYTEINENELNN